MKVFIHRYGRALSWFVRLEILASAFALAVICGLTMTAITMRATGGSLLWAEEVSLLLMKVVVFPGAAGLYAQRGYIVVGGLVKTFPRRLRHLTGLLSWMLIGGFAATVAWQGMLTYPSQIEVRSYLLELPKFYFNVPLIVGSTSIVLTSIYYFLATIAAGPSSEEIEFDAHVPAPSGLADLS